MTVQVATSILILSDTHGESIAQKSFPNEQLDLVIHCGDLTQHSKLSEFRRTIRSLAAIKADLKIVIAGNHDFSLDAPVLRNKIDEAKRTLAEGLDDGLLEREYGKPGEAQRLLQSAQEEGIVFLEEGNHTLALANGASVKIYASPFTPCAGGEWGFQYNGEHDFKIDADCDVAITHGPPKGILDMTEEKKRIGCPQLFKAIAKAQPKLHCFGHVHNGWGARFVSWRPKISDEPSHFTDIDNAKSRVIATLSKWKTMSQGRTLDFIETLPSAIDDRVETKNAAQIDNTITTADMIKTEQITIRTSHTSGQQLFLESGKTLFINAASMGDTGLEQPFWLVDLELNTESTADPVEEKANNISKKRGRKDYGIDDMHAPGKKRVLL